MKIVATFGDLLCPNCRTFTPDLVLNDFFASPTQTCEGCGGPVWVHNGTMPEWVNLLTPPVRWRSAA